MKCSKCNYISFDYNQACPKCKKDLDEIRQKMNLPFFRPSPLPLPSLTGKEPLEAVTLEQDADFGSKETEELKFSSPSDLDMSFESASVQDEEEPDMDFSLEDEDDELSLDFDDLALGGAAAETSPSGQTKAKDTLGSDLDFSLEDESDELSLEIDEHVIERTQTKTPEKDQEISRADSIEASLDLAFGDDSDENIDLDDEMNFADEDEVTEAFDLGELSSAGSKQEPDLEIAEDDGQISLDLEDSVSILEESPEVAESVSFSEAEQEKNISSELEVLDLELDLEKSEDK